MLENLIIRYIRAGRICVEPKFDVLKTGAMLKGNRLNFENWDAYKNKFDSFETYWYDLDYTYL